VAEKPSISKAVAGHLSGGSYQTVSSSPSSCQPCLRRAQHNTRSQYIKNYAFTFDFGPPWGNCDVTMTCVTGHLTEQQFGPDYKDWRFPPPERLFDAPLHTVVNDVRRPSPVSRPASDLW